MSGLIIHVADYDARKLQLTREKTAVQSSNPTLTQDNPERVAELQPEITATEND